ncbi:MAG: pyrrolo-quinoline quinone, partial [Rubripirellula sp.]
MSIRLRRLTSTAITSLVSIQILTFSCLADDWRGWMGNARDGVYRETGIINEIPETGLPVKWRVPIYSGYAGPAAADGRVFVFDYQQTAG